jgi:chorismate mutase
MEVYFHSPSFLRVFNKEILSLIHNMYIAFVIKILIHNRRFEYTSVLGYDNMSVGKLLLKCLRVLLLLFSRSSTKVSILQQAILIHSLEGQHIVARIRVNTQNNADRRVNRRNDNIYR